MNRIPGEKPIPNKNRSSKQYYGLTRSGLKAFWAWQKSKGIPVYKSPKKKDKKPVVDPTAETK